MTFFFEVLLLVGISGASLYLGYRYAIDFAQHNSQKHDDNYVPVEDEDVELGGEQIKIKSKENTDKEIKDIQDEYQIKQKEIDQLNTQLREFKQREKKYQAELQLLKLKTTIKPTTVKQTDVMSDQEFNNLLEEQL